MKILFSGLLCSLYLLCNFSFAATLSPQGIWRTETGSAYVEIYACEKNLCGSIVMLKDQFTDKGVEVTDSENPDSELRDRKVQGLEIIRGLQSGNEPGLWKSGEIYDPESGNTYKVSLEVLDNNTLELNGYIGFEIFGRKVRWTRIPDNWSPCDDFKKKSI